MTGHARWVAIIGAGLLVLGGSIASNAAQPSSLRQDPGQEDSVEKDQGQDGEIRGGSAAFNLEQSDRETVWIDQGMPIFETPDASSARLAVIDFRSELEVLDRQGEWCQVRHASRLGWVHPELPFKDRVIEFERDLDSLAVSIPAMRAEAFGHAELVKRLLGPDLVVGRLGPYELLTDVQDDETLEALASVAGHLDDYYEERYGLELGDTGAQTVALFATEETYRQFEHETTDRPRDDRHGHAIGNVASLFVGHKRSDELRPLLVHELTHLINRRAFGPRPPAWIEEGVANDVGLSKVDRFGRPMPETLAGDNVVYGPRFERQIAFSGGFSSLSQLITSRSRRQGTPLDRLVDMPHDEFMGQEDRQRYYTESTFLIRLLLDGPRSEWTEGFLLYLSEVAEGERPDADRLSTLLGSSWPQVERTFDSWLRLESVRLLP